ncbi:MAG: Thiamine kinase [Candidatus Celerinatantimonas neptuna]|nr:MAG: Thiamine kinase [Candidatus Celerinatantimonas neptuna]
MIVATTPEFMSQMSSECRYWLKQQLGSIEKYQPIPGGHHNIWWCKSPSGQYVLRQPNKQAIYGIDYQREQIILQDLIPYHWAISGMFFTPDEPWLIYPYVEGQSVGQKQFYQNRHNWQQLCHIVTQLQSRQYLYKPRYKRVMRDYLYHYLTLARFAPQEALAKAHEWLIDFPRPSALSLNHHDLTSANLLITPNRQLVILDWEYAAFSDQGWDCAVLAESFEFHPEQLLDLRQLYGLSEHRLEQYRLASRLLDLCWFSQLPLSSEHIRAWEKWDDSISFYRLDR